MKDGNKSTDLWQSYGLVVMGKYSCLCQVVSSNLSTKCLVNNFSHSFVVQIFVLLKRLKTN